MFLLADCVSLADPCGKLFIQIVETIEAKSVQVVSWRESFNPREARMLKPPREYKVTNEVVSAQLHRDE